MANTTAYTQQQGEELYSIEISSTAYVYPNAAPLPLDPMIYQKVFEVTSGLVARRTIPLLGMIDFIIQEDGELTDLRVFGDPGSGVCTFNWRLNGAPLYAAGTRPILDSSSTTVGSSDKLVEKTSVGVAVLKGDLVRLDLEEVTGTGLYPDVTGVAIVQT